MLPLYSSWYLGSALFLFDQVYAWFPDAETDALSMTAPNESDGDVMALLTPQNSQARLLSGSDEDQWHGVKLFMC